MSKTLGQMIDIKVEHNDYKTNEPYKAFAWLVAVKEFNFEQGLAQEVADLIYELYITSDEVNGVELAYYICENYDELPNDFKEIKNKMYEQLLGTW